MTKPDTPFPGTGAITSCLKWVVIAGAIALALKWFGVF